MRLTEVALVTKCRFVDSPWPMGTALEGELSMPSDCSACHRSDQHRDDSQRRSDIEKAVSHS